MTGRRRLMESCTRSGQDCDRSACAASWARCVDSSFASGNEQCHCSPSSSTVLNRWRSPKPVWIATVLTLTHRSGSLGWCARSLWHQASQGLAAPSASSSSTRDYWRRSLTCLARGAPRVAFRSAHLTARAAASFARVRTTRVQMV